MDEIDSKICEMIQVDGRLSSAELAREVGLSLSAANERLRRLEARGVISAWRAVLNAEAVGLPLLAFMLIDMTFEGEEEAKRELAAAKEVQELHHISGAHSYLMKLRVRSTQHLQQFLSEKVKPLKAVTRSETIFVLESVKETTALILPEPKVR